MSNMDKHKQALKEARALRPRTCSCGTKLPIVLFGIPPVERSKFSEDRVWHTKCVVCGLVWYTPRNSGFYISVSESESESE